MTAVLLVAPMPVAEYRAGPAIRYWEFARVLSAEHKVTLLVPNDDYPTHLDFAVRTCDNGELETLLAAHQVVVVQGPALQQHLGLAPLLATGGQHLVVDLYDPITLEQLEIDPGGDAGRWLQKEYGALLNEQLLLGDFFLCASDRQRDFWLGSLAALGRINHETYDGGELRRLVEVVPFGLPAEPPRSGEPVLKGVVPGIEPSDHVILWGGGLWDWLDPLTPIVAMQQVVPRHPSARLLFFESERYQSPMLARAKDLAAALGLLDQQVLFADWLPPEQWGRGLLEADIGLSFHQPTVETHFAFRTRLLDYVWAGLPIVAASGDVLADLVVAQGLGHVVDPGNEQALASALIALLDEADARSNRRDAFARVAGPYQWERVAGPLASYCRQPWHAPDRDSAFERNWRAAQSEQLRAQAARAERRLADTQDLVEALFARIERCEEQLDRVMSGRVMRLMTGVQRALWGGR
jgi:hypothetical protein